MKEFTKITYDIMASEENIMELLPEIVKWHLIGNTSDKQFSMIESLVGCESPIEQLLAIELDRIWETISIPVLIEDIFIDNQKEVIAGECTYRPDFIITVKYWNTCKKYAIECDGHEFHQKTKRQVERDNERTRNLQAAGYIVIRFSGTEIYHRATRCAQEIKRIIQAPAIQRLKKVLDNEQNKR